MSSVKKKSITESSVLLRNLNGLESKENLNGEYIKEMIELLKSYESLCIQSTEEKQKNEEQNLANLPRKEQEVVRNPDLEASLMSYCIELQASIMNYGLLSLFSLLVHQNQTIEAFKTKIQQIRHQNQPDASYNRHRTIVYHYFYYIDKYLMLNIPSTIVDPKYRYRMAKMQTKIESKGNGIKTNIVNLGEVAKDLRTNEQYILKWFGFEKASQTTFKEAGGKNNTNYIINGEFTEEDLRKVLDKFIEKYICCPKCKLPEMHMQVVGDKIVGKCDSCPFVGDLDNKHRLATFILKNPPVAKSMATGKVVKVQAQKAAMPSQFSKEKKSQQKQVKVQQEVISFDIDKMQFGSEELQNFGLYIKKEVESLKDEDFDIASAKIVSKIKPLGLKKPLIANILFKTFFTVNITQQLAEHSKIYLNLMKKLVHNQNTPEITEIQTLLNIQFLFLQASKEKDFTKYLPTILFNVVKEGLLSEQFLLSWYKGQIKDIENNFFFNAQRDSDFKKAVSAYLQSLGDQQEQQQTN